MVEKVNVVVEPAKPAPTRRDDEVGVWSVGLEVGGEEVV